MAKYRFARNGKIEEQVCVNLNEAFDNAISDLQDGLAWPLYIETDSVRYKYKHNSYDDLEWMIDPTP